MKRSVFFLSIILLMGLTVSCNSNASSRTPKTNVQGYTLNVVGGTTNLDASFFNPSSLTEVKAQVLEEALATQFGLSTPLTSLVVLEGQLQPAATRAIAANLFVSVTENGEATGLPTNITVKGYEGKVELTEEESWTEQFPLPPNKSGSYHVYAESEAFKLREAVSIDTSEGAKLLPVAQGLRVQATPELIWASWEPVEGARSYIGLLYDSAKQETVWAASVKGKTEMYGEVSLESSSRRYDLSVFALSWDTLHPRDTVYSPLPERVDASVASAYAIVSNYAEFSTEPRVVNLSAELGETSTISVELEQNGGPVAYEATLPEASHLRFLSGDKGVVSSFKEPVTLELSATCPAKAQLIRETITLQTSHSDTATLLPVNLECLKPLEAGRVAWQPNLKDIVDIAWSPDGSRLATLGESFGKLIIWRTSDYSAEHVIDVRGRPYHGVDALAWSPDGKRLAVADNYVVRIFDSETGSEVTSFDAISTSGFVAWSSDSVHLAVAGDENSPDLGVFNTNSGKLLWKKTVPDVYDGITWNHDGSLLLVSSYTELMLVDGANGKTLRTIKNVIGDAIFTPDDSEVVALSYNSATFKAVDLSVWNAATGELVRTLKTFEGVDPWDLELNRTGTELALLTSNSDWDTSTLDILDFDTGMSKFKQTFATPDTNSAQHPQLAWNPKADEIAVSDAGGKVTVITSETGAPIETLGFTEDRIRQLAAAPSGDKFAFTGGYHERPLRIVDLSLNTLAEIPASDGWSSFSWLGGDEKLATLTSINDTHLLKTWDATIARQLSSVSISGGASDYSWSADGRRLVATNGYNALSLFNVETGQKLGEIKRQYGPVVWKPDHTQVAALRYGAIDIYDVATGQVVEEIQKDRAAESALWLADNRLLVISNRDFSVWDMTSSVQLFQQSLSNDLNERLYKGVSADGRKLAYLTDTTLEIRSLISGEVIYSTPLEEASQDSLVVWSGDGNFLLLAMRDSFQIWSVD